MSEIEQIKHEVTRFRNAAERYAKGDAKSEFGLAGEPWNGFKYFPKHCHEIAVSLLARYLNDIGCGQAVYCQTNVNGDHCWLRLGDELVIDFCADLLPNSKEKVIVSDLSTTHGYLAEDSTPPLQYGFGVDPYQGKLSLKATQDISKAYAAILSLV